LVGVLFVLLGIGLLIAAVTFAARTHGFKRDAAAAEGVVVRLNAGGSHPQIEFTTAAGQTISYPQGGFLFGYQPGDRVRVLYSPGEPARTACVDAFGALWFTSLLLGAMGLCFVGGGLFAALG
jgi:Protein of unknown function (DUF3592)